MIRIVKGLILGVSLFILTSCNDTSVDEVVVNEIDCNELDDMLDDGAVLIDVRTVDEYNSGNISGSINIPMDELDNIKDIVDYGEEVILYCQSGVRSLDSANLLIDMGYEKVYDLGGIDSCD